MPTSPTESSPPLNENDLDPRVAIIAEWILAGMRISQIPAHIEKNADKWPGNAPTATELLDMIDQAHATIRADAEIDIERENDKAIARLNFLYTKSCAIQDYKGAATIQKELNCVIARVTLTRPKKHGQARTQA